MPQQTTEAFEARYLELLERHYAFGDHRSEARAALNHRIGGFIEAGLLLEVTSAERLQALTDETHLRIFFGESLAERKTRAMLGHKETMDWSIYDIPPRPPSGSHLRCVPTQASRCVYPGNLCRLGSCRPNSRRPMKAAW